MEYEINRENLQGAYLKLKHYIYYYNSSLYLKKKMLAFEKQWKDQEAYDAVFEKLAQRICRLKDIKDNYRLRGESISWMLYPKKDKVQLENISDVVVEESNVFVDAPIWVHLIDILFVMNIYEKTSDKLDSEYSYGVVFDQDYKNSGKRAQCPLLFDNHNVFYNNWKGKPYKAFHDIDAEKAILIKLDLKRCFYNFEFNITDFIEEVFKSESDSLICKLEKEIHNYYTAIIKNKFMNKMKWENVSVLPIGLISSSIILNYYLHNIDIKLGEKCLSYGRYVDDILMLIEYNDAYSSIKNKQELLQNAFPDCFFEKDGNLFLLAGKLLPLNDKKLSISIINKGDNDAFRDIMIKLTSASLEDDNDSDLSSPVEANVRKISKIRKKLYDYSLTDEEKRGTILKLNDAELINSFPIWKDMLTYDEEEHLYSKIQDAIKKIQIGKNDEFLTNDHAKDLQSNLRNELITARACSKNGGEYKTHYFVQIEQQDIFDYIESYDRKRSMCFPYRVTKSDLMFYLQTQKEEIELEQLVETVDNLYNSINMLEIERGATFVFEELGERIVIIKNRFVEECSEKNYKIAIANIHVDTKNNNQAITEYDFNPTAIPPITLNQILQIIKDAAKGGAAYILFPEFCIKYSDALRVISECYKSKISLISGLTHVFFCSGGHNYAFNATLVYSYPLKKPFIHKKKYLAPDELRALIDHGYIGLDSDEPYIAIDDGNLFYSIMTCYEATNIIDRASFKNINLEAMFLPIYNKDINYYASIVDSFARDISCYMVQSNVNDYGDSRITGPLKTLFKDLAKVKGGINNYFVIGELNFTEKYAVEAYEDGLKALRNRAISASYLDDLKHYIDCFSNDVERAIWKPSSAD